MTDADQPADPSGDGPATRPHPLRRGATPAVIREWLLPEDRDRFLAEYQTAMDRARQSLDLSPVHELVEHWRGIAVTQSDPAAFRRSIRRWAELVTGESSPDDEPLATTRAKAGI